MSSDKPLGRHEKAQTSETADIAPPATRALLIIPCSGGAGTSGNDAGSGARTFAARRTTDARIAEAMGLAEAVDLEVIGAEPAIVSRIRPATYLGKGKVSQLADIIKDAAVDLVIMDCALSPVQQRNLERAFSAKVIDRTGLILEIFGRRARTREGTLQVELAHLAYQKSRLVRSWTHLERQRGGFGFLGGPGESQIETDRRLIGERMGSIERELEKVKKTRGLHRKSRRAVPYPIVALVGYTNAGKSTLFNRLTRADVVAADMLFATLDPTMRRVTLPLGCDIILSDTVGFISSLPTMLVSAFRATLEEVREADIILHVRDISHMDTDAQRTDVEAVLAELGIDPADDPRVIEVWNKADLLDEDGLARATSLARSKAVIRRPMVVSALTGQGIDGLLSALEAKLATDKIRFDISLDPANGAGFSWLHAHTEVVSKDMSADGTTVQMTVRVMPERAEVVRRRFLQAPAIVGERER